jgi:hypothetical protein
MKLTGRTVVILSVALAVVLAAAASDPRARPGWGDGTASNTGSRVTTVGPAA